MRGSATRHASFARSVCSESASLDAFKQCPSYIMLWLSVGMCTTKHAGRSTWMSEVPVSEHSAVGLVVACSSMCDEYAPCCTHVLSRVSCSVHCWRVCSLFFRVSSTTSCRSSARPAASCCIMCSKMSTAAVSMMNARHAVIAGASAMSDTAGNARRAISLSFSDASPSVFRSRSQSTLSTRVSASSLNRAVRLCSPRIVCRFCLTCSRFLSDTPLRTLSKRQSAPISACAGGIRLLHWKPIAVSSPA